MMSAPAQDGTEPAGAGGAPVAQPDDLVVADVELVLMGLLRHADPLGGRVPQPLLGGSGDADGAAVTVPVSSEVASTAVEAGVLVLTDAESTPVAALHDVREAATSVDGTRGGEPAVTGRLLAGRPAEAGAGRDLRPDPRSAWAAGRRVVVLGRPLLGADLRALSGATTPPVLVVPVAGPSPDGVPAATLLRLARDAAPSLGARVVAVPLAWRDPDSDAALVAHVAAGSGASEVLHLRPARYAAADGGVAPGAGSPHDGDWVDALRRLRAGADVSDVGASAVVAELRRWQPPRHERGLVVLFTGLSGSGKSTLARSLATHLAERTTRTVSLLDGDVVRRNLSAGLGFGARDRDLNVRRIGFVAAEVARHGGVAICAPIAPYERSRAAVRRMVEEVGDLVLVHVDTPLEECERRDLKGLYARARAGEVPEFTGISDPYEVPADADLRVDTSQLAPQAALDLVLRHLRRGGWVVDA